MTSKEIFAEIRTAAADVARQARHVSPHEERIAAYAAALQENDIDPPSYDTLHHFIGAPPATASFLLALDSVNFGSGYFPFLHKRAGLSGYFTIALSLKERWETTGLLTGGELRAMRADDCAILFGQEGNAGPIAELMTLFSHALNDLGEWLGRRYDDDPLGPIEDAGKSAARLVDLVTAMPLFRDVSSYRGQKVPLYKRAQLLVADLALAFDGEGPGEFHDLDELTIFADNLVPHVLRVDGLLAYDDDLLARIERGELIPAGSPQEIEIRAVALHTVEQIVAELRDMGTERTARELDFLLWNRGQGTAYKGLPRHRTRTTNY